ncbi:transcriptional repressor [Acuticoccus sp. M5D2P5]|uniref:Fur family transcriptional regulator n=1 Tax=Acuticoccus kalidii TaxID=2910977 RepID=UPI001F3DA592|nr:transcriptional repressor [Acuticoccus kalidii]MCF3935501.1 transcriptional repressor [Acuticoccus kalidii]
MNAKLNITQTAALSALREAGRPLTAYEVLDVLRASRHSAAPPTAYRALGKLIELGLAHRLESVNAYVACCAEHEEAQPAFSICGDCGAVAELTDPTIGAGIAAIAAQGGFAPTKSVIELHGRCASCRGNA